MTQINPQTTQINQSNFTSISQMSEYLSKKSPVVSEKELNDDSFEAVLKKTSQKQQESSELKFSKHANERLASRQIDLTGEQLMRLQGGTSRAREKGIKESLVMVDNLAFIVNISSNTVVTAVNDTKDAVFTNIDGAIIS
ncbi:MAG: flagellar protein [Clostridiales bacterium]|nr:flagellar protein [Clostridiales bacterium]